MSTAADCKVRWINIRDVNRRILRKCLNNPSQRVRTYKYDSELSFMRPFYRDVPIKNDDYEFEDDPDKDESIMNNDDFHHHEDMEDEGLPEFSDTEKNKTKVRKTRTKRTKTVKRKKKRTYTEEEENEIKPETSVFSESLPQELDPTDPVDAFLLSIGATLKTFNPYHLNLAKSKIFAVVQEHDLQQIVQRRDNQIEQKICTSDTMVFVNNMM